VAAGLLLYLFDKLARTVQSARPARVLSLTHAAGITKVVVSADALAGLRGSGPSHYPGQYVFLNIPALDPLQWHPFTISSGPAADPSAPGASLTFHIKDMGPKTWTHDLADLALSLRGGAGVSASPASLDQERKLRVAAGIGPVSVSLDGPYGRAGHYYERETLLLVAGGIGFTPFHSLLLDLQERALSGAGAIGKVARVVVVWVVREPAVAAAFASTLTSLLADNPDGLFDVTVYCTGAGGGGGGGGKVVQPRDLEEEDQDTLSPVDAGWTDVASSSAVLAALQPGRPDLGRIFADIAQEVRRRGARKGASKAGAGGEEAEDISDLVTAMVCGPERMIAEVSGLALEHRMDFHSETFHF
jgi:ferredoxin-NADP reductase